MQQKQVYYDHIRIHVPERVDKTQGIVTRGSSLPSHKPDFLLTLTRQQALQQSLTQARHEQLLAALEHIIRATSEGEQAWQVLMNDTIRRAFYSVHYKSKKDRTWHTVPGIESQQDREDLTSCTMEALSRRLPTWRGLPPDKRLAWYFRQQRWQHISWYRRMCTDRDRGTIRPHTVGAPVAVLDDMHAAVLALCAAPEVGERPQPLRLESAGAASAARLAALLAPQAGRSSAAPPRQGRTRGPKPTAPHETHDLVADAVSLLTALSTATEGSSALRQGSTALLRRCFEESSLCAVAQDLHIEASTLRGYVLTTRHYLKAQLDLR